MHSTTARLLASALVAGALLLSACSDVPREPASITGTVSDIAQADDATTILVTGTGQFEKASVLLDARTTMLRNTTSGVAALRLYELVDGVKVSVWFDGPVAESYPVQAHAGTILMLEPLGP